MALKVALISKLLMQNTRKITLGLLSGLICVIFAYTFSGIFDFDGISGTGCVLFLSVGMLGFGYLIIKWNPDLTKPKLRKGNQSLRGPSDKHFKDLTLEQQITITQRTVLASELFAKAEPFSPAAIKFTAFVSRNFLISIAIGIMWWFCVLGQGLGDGKTFLGVSKPFSGLSGGPSFRRDLSFPVVQLILLCWYFAPVRPQFWIACRLAAAWSGALGLYSSIRYGGINHFEQMLALYIWGSYLAFGIFGRRRLLEEL
jgi:hypothetical protein